MSTQVEPVLQRSAVEQAELVRNRDVSPVELVDAYLARIDALNPALGAFVTIAHDQAREAAAEAERRVSRGDDLPPFHGVPIAIKDLNATAGLLTTCSTRTYADFVPDTDHHVVRRLGEAGFITLGKTNTPELGSFAVTESELNGACRNPWDTDRTPGGSSGGAASALAAGLIPVAQGNDGGGSIRIPSSCCGLFGIKPSRGRVSQGPDLGDVLFGLDTDGPLARTVLDAAAVLDVMAGYETGDPYWAAPPARPFAQEAGVDPGRLRIAVTTVPMWEAPVHADCVAAVEDAAGLLEALGHSVVEASPEWSGPDVFAAMRTLFQSLIAYHPIDDFSVLEPANRILAEAGRRNSSIDLVRAVVTLQAYSRRVVRFWDGYDVVLSPVLAQPPLRIGEVFAEEDPWQIGSAMMNFMPFTPAANITGQPAVSVPLHWSGEGLPIGVQLMGRPQDEATLIRLGAQLEQARPWADRRPAPALVA
jgi:amidase